MNEEILLDKIIEITQENILLKKENEYLKNKLEKSNIKLNDDIDALFNPDNFRFGDKPKTKLERLQNMISDDFWDNTAEKESKEQSKNSKVASKDLKEMFKDDDFWRDDKSEKRKVGVKNETKFRR